MKNFVKLLLLCTIICLGSVIGLNINEVYAYTYAQDSLTSQTPPPSKYDLRDKIHIGVEHQHNFGICYAFASLTSLETYLALTYNEYYDFSEIHFASSLCLKDAYYPTVNDTLNDGGNFNHFILYTQKDDSLILDQLMPIDTYRVLTSYQREEKIKADYNIIDSNFYPLVKVNDTKSFDGLWGNKSKYKPEELTNFRTSIKNHIMKYGSISASIYSGSNFTQSTKYYRVIDDSTATSKEAVRTKVNHMISVVGWDDGYDANGAWENKGAYLCLNSWGTSFGDNGYFYVSYDDYFIESSMHGVVDATLCTTSNKISTIATYQNNTRIYSHIYNNPPTTYTANIINVADYLNQTITSIDNFVLGSSYSVYYKFFNSYNDAVSGINSATTKINISSNNLYSLYNKLNLTSGLEITNNYLLLVTRVDDTYEINSIGGSALNNLNLIPTYSQQKGLRQFNLNDDKWSPSVPNGPADLTIPVILHLNNTTIEVLPFESQSQSITYDKYIKNNATYKDKTLIVKLNNATLTQDIINNIKIINVDENIDITSNFEISLSENNINIKLIKIDNLNFAGINNYLISIPYDGTTIYRVFEIQNIGELYSIVYNLDGGQANNPTTYTSQHTTLTLNPATKDGYEFNGWYLDSDFTRPFNPSNLPYTNLILYAKYEIKAPTLVSKSNDISIKYNGADTLLSLVAIHPLTQNGYTIKYQWYYTPTLSSTFEAISDASDSTFAVKNIDQSGYYACDVSLVDVSSNVVSYISHSNSETHIKVTISKADLNININDILSSTELSNDELNNMFSCEITSDYLPDGITEYNDILNYLQLKFMLSDTENPFVKTISATINEFEFYNLYIKPGQYRIVINTLSSNNIYSTSDKGFTVDCTFNVAEYGINSTAKQLLKDQHLNFINSYDISYSNLDTSATIYIPVSSRNILRNLAVYMYKDNQLIKLDVSKSTEGISFTTTEADATYIIVQEKGANLTNGNLLILVIIIAIIGTFAVYSIITKLHKVKN